MTWNHSLQWRLSPGSARHAIYTSLILASLPAAPTSKLPPFSGYQGTELILSHMAPPALVIAGLIIIPISLATSLTIYWYRRFRARHAQQRTQHHHWHRGLLFDVELLPMRPNTDAQQAVKHEAAEHASWPRSLHDSDGIPNKRFTPRYTIPVPYWGPSDEWGPKDVPVLTPYSGPSRDLDQSSRLQADTTMSRGKTTLDAKETSGFPCHAGSRESTDPAREIWRKMREERESFEDVPLDDAIAPACGQDQEANVERVARLYKLAAQRVQVQNRSHCL